VSYGEPAPPRIPPSYAEWRFKKEVVGNGTSFDTPIQYDARFTFSSLQFFEYGTGLPPVVDSLEICGHPHDFITLDKHACLTIPVPIMFGWTWWKFTTQTRSEAQCHSAAGDHCVGHQTFDPHRDLVHEFKVYYQDNPSLFKRASLQCKEAGVVFMVNDGLRRAHPTVPIVICMQGFGRCANTTDDHDYFKACYNLDQLSVTTSNKAAMTLAERINNIAVPTT
jgi:hypothetical protein